MINKMTEKVSEKVLRQNIRNILNEEYLEAALATVGENRGQSFIRIPKIVSQRLKITKGDKIKFEVKNKGDKVIVTLEKDE